jgi:hypothetical protein
LIAVNLGNGQPVAIARVNSPLMFDHPQKSVCYADFTSIADPEIANLSNNYLFYHQELVYQSNPFVGNHLRLLESHNSQEGISSL